MSFYTMLRKYSKRMRGLHLLSVSSFYILGALFKKKTIIPLAGYLQSQIQREFVEQLLNIDINNPDGFLVLRKSTQN